MGPREAGGKFARIGGSHRLTADASAVRPAGKASNLAYHYSLPELAAQVRRIEQSP